MMDDPGRSTQAPQLARRLMLGIAGVAALAGGAGAWWLMQRRDTDAPHPRDAQAMADAAAALYATVLPDPAGIAQPFSQWKGQVLVVNFWATWCVPCREEMPHFVKMQAQYGKQGLTFVGIAIDRAERVRRFMDEIGVNYPIVVGELAVFELARKAGNVGDLLPFTVVLDRSGRIVARRAGTYTAETLGKIVEPLL